MDNSQNMGNHRLNIINRQRGSLNGIKKVISFAPEEVKLSTERGRLTICGESLHVISLSVEKGELEFEGRIDSMVYADEKTAGKFIGRLFR
ncbi:MAG: YabP/YqfC family sporulation protein [Lachnospiraceae bacterium]|nr:YabP/YqfC family sporulation protein [Lachnospiraceae bacterium]